MKVAVIGAGIIGVTTAYELSADGHQVTVFERRGSVAAEASFAHPGLVAPGCIPPWAAHGAAGAGLRQLFNRHAPLRLRSGLNPAAIAWLWAGWRASRLRTRRANALRLQCLAHYSRERLHELRHELKLDYERADGCLLLLRSAHDLTRAQPGLALLAELKTRFDTLDAAQCRAVEPGLNPHTALHAGIYLPDGEVGNCRQFAHLLRQQAQRLGARFRFHADVSRIIPGARPQLVYTHAPPTDAVMPAASGHADPRAFAHTQPMSCGPMPGPITQTFDAVVVCNALGAPGLLRPHGLKLALQAVHGHSITAPLRQHETHPDSGPRAGLIDDRYQVTISRLGTRVRVAGGAEIGGSTERSDDRSLATLYKVLHDWFPGAARLSQVQRWKGSRPMLPDGPPVLGRSGIEGVWLNLGHGSSGWALACGSARVLADSLAARVPTIDIEGLGVERLGR